MGDRTYVSNQGGCCVLFVCGIPEKKRSTDSWSRLKQPDPKTSSHLPSHSLSDVLLLLMLYPFSATPFGFFESSRQAVGFVSSFTDFGECHEGKPRRPSPTTHNEPAPLAAIAPSGFSERTGYPFMPCPSGSRGCCLRPRWKT